MTDKALLLCLAMLGVSTQADAQAWRDLSPDTSNLHATQHNGASGGRVNGVAGARDKSAFYAATEFGGLYRSNDSGKTWKFLPSHLPFATWRVAVDPADANKVYATSFYDGRVNSLAGLNVSRDGGATWTHPASAAANTSLCERPTKATNPSAFGIAIDPDRSRHVIVGTNCGLDETNDAGATWTPLYPHVGKGADDVWSVVIHDGGVIDACGDDGHMRTTDGGRNWTTRDSVPLPSGRCSIAVAPRNGNLLVAVVGEDLFESIDGGNTWALLLSPEVDFGGRVPVVATNARSDSSFDLWYGDIQLWRASCRPARPDDPGPRCPAGGWESDGYWAGAHEDIGQVLFDPAAPVDACPLLLGTDGGIELNIKHENPFCHDPAWRQPDKTPHALWVRGMRVVVPLNAIPKDATHHLYFGTQDNGSFGTTNAAAARPTWLNLDPADVGDVLADSVRVMNTVCCYGAEGKRLFRRSLEMLGSIAVDSLLPLPLLGNDGVVAQFSRTGYAILTDSGVFITHDITTPKVQWRPMKWPKGSPPSRGAVTVSDSAGVPVLFVQAGKFDGRSPDRVWRLVPVDSGIWREITPPKKRGGFGLFAADRWNSERLFASHVRAGADPEMIASSDGGMSWKAVPALDTCMTRNGTFRYQNEAGPTGIGGGRTGLDGYGQPTIVVFDPYDRSIILAGAVDAGIFISRDSGATWTAVTDPFHPESSGIRNIPRPRIAQFIHEASSIHIYVGTQGRGVWRLQIPLTAPSVPTGLQCAPSSVMPPPA